MTSPFDWTDERRALWERVEAALDQGRHPLLDPALRKELDADPALLEATGRLVHRLEIIEGSPGSPVEPTGTALSSASRLRALGAVAAALLLILALRVSRSSSTGPASDQQPTRSAPPAVTLVVERVLPRAPLGRTVTLTEESVQHWTLTTYPE